jgi:hypothetical protein
MATSIEKICVLSGVILRAFGSSLSEKANGLQNIREEVYGIYH